MRLLVIDDAPDICELLKGYLQSRGVEIICVYDGEAGTAKYFQLIREAVPFVVLLDLALPLKNGFDVLKEIRAHEKTGVRRTPVITFSAYTDDVKGTKLLEESGTDWHIEKPDRNQELLPAIMNALKSFE